jgi:hypothetical protein
MTEKARGFQVGLKRALKEQESADFQLAGLMAANESRITAFTKARQRDFLASAGRRVRLITYAPRPDAADATSKVVAVFEVTNGGPEPLNLSSGSALRVTNVVPIALRAIPSEIPPGGTGRVAVVLDRASFGSGETITLRLSDRPLNMGIQLEADLALEDFMAPKKAGIWGP